MRPNTGIKDYNPRPSIGDLERLHNDSTNLNYPVPMYVIDKDNVYLAPPGTTEANIKQKLVKYPGVEIGCPLL